MKEKLETINSFLKQEDLTPAEELVKKNIIDLDKQIKDAYNEKSQLTEALKKKTIEIERLDGALQHYFNLVEELYNMKVKDND